MKLHPFAVFGAAATAALIATGANAADLLVNGPDPIYSSPLFNFEGFYVGGSLGVGKADSLSRLGMVGVVAGANFAVTDGILAGLEFQGDALWDHSGIDGMDALFLGKLGTYLTDSTLLYGDAGAGWIIDQPSYALGLGIEQAVTDQMSVRGEGMLTGPFGDSPDGGRLTASLIWHMQ